MTARRLIALLPAGLLGAGAAVLVSCGSSGAGLIPSENAGPLVADFQAVEREALKGSGNCAPTEAALRTTERDFAALPASIDAGLRAKLRQGISHLHNQALELCAQALSTTTGGTTSTTQTTPPPSPTTKTAPTSTTPPTSSTTGAGTTPPSTTPSSGAEGGTAPEVGGSEGKAGEGDAGDAQGGAGSGQEGSGSSESPEGANNGGAGVGGGGSGQ